MENNLGRKTVTPSLLTPIAKVNSSLPISYDSNIQGGLVFFLVGEHATARTLANRTHLFLVHCIPTSLQIRWCTLNSYAHSQTAPTRVMASSRMMGSSVPWKRMISARFINPLKYGSLWPSILPKHVRRGRSEMMRSWT